MSQRCQESVGREVTEGVSGKGCKLLFFLARRSGEERERWTEVSYGSQRFYEQPPYSSACDAQIKLFVFLGMEEEKEKPKVE